MQSYVLDGFNNLMDNNLGHVECTVAVTTVITRLLILWINLKKE